MPVGLQLVGPRFSEPLLVALASAISARDGPPHQTTEGVSRQLDRAIAIAVLRRGDEILVSEVPDPTKNITGWRAPGGGSNSASGCETVVREIDEELGVASKIRGIWERSIHLPADPGVQGHQLVRVYEVRFADPELYARDHFDCIEANGIRFACIWKPLAEFGERAPLYPDGLLELIS